MAMSDNNIKRPATNDVEMTNPSNRSGKPVKKAKHYLDVVTEENMLVLRNITVTEKQRLYYKKKRVRDDDTFQKKN